MSVGLTSDDGGVYTERGRHGLIEQVSEKCGRKEGTRGIRFFLRILSWPSQPFLPNLSGASASRLLALCLGQYSVLDPPLFLYLTAVYCCPSLRHCGRHERKASIID